MNSKESIKEFILLELINDPNIKNLEDRDPLIETSIIDSLGIVKLLVFLEETFNIHIPDGEIVPENFESVEAILLLVNDLLT
jgi:acyl carrier protein